MVFVNLNCNLAYSGLAIGFQNSDVQPLNSFRKTNVFYKKLLNTKNLPAELAAHAKIMSTKAPQLMPHFTLQNGKIEFKHAGKKFTLTKISATKFELNGRAIDLENKNWIHDIESTYNSSLWESALITQAHALAPLYFLIWGIVIVVSSGCIVNVLGSQNSSGSIKAKWIYVNNKMFNDAMKEVHKGMKAIGCAANASEMPSDEADYQSFFKDRCKKAEATDAELEALYTKHKFNDANKQVALELMNSEEFMQECLLSKLTHSLDKMAEDLGVDTTTTK